jgi:predicted MFS family arabinose efflux permease
VLGVVAFVVWERRHPHPMLDLAFFAERRMSVGALSIAAAYFALFGMYFVFTQYLQSVRGYSPLAAGLYALPAGLAQFAIANAAKPLVARHGFRPVLVAGLAAGAVGLALLAGTGGDSPIGIVEVGLGLLGAGIGLTMPPATGAVMSALPPHKAGVGSAVNDLARELGGAFGIGVLGSITLSRYRDRLAVNPVPGTPSAANQPTGIAGSLAARSAYTSGLDLAMLVGAVLVAVAAVAVHVALRGADRPRASQPRVMQESGPIR